MPNAARGAAFLRPHFAAAGECADALPDGFASASLRRIAGKPARFCPFFCVAGAFGGSRRNCKFSEQRAPEMCHI
ncbi:MAG: hypothetical protein DBY30_06110 [Verrucomicrobia bacterium]|nr:MAG: hypothetical protein DBY30_06110 [Verrucomicrobiota bacterium]